jgi:hypothetical protein
MLPKFQTGPIACEELGIFSTDLSGSSALEASWEARYYLDCVWTLCGLGG